MPETTRWVIVESWCPDKRDPYLYREQLADGKTFETSEQAKKHQTHLKAKHAGGDFRVMLEGDFKAALARQKLDRRQPPQRRK